MHGNATVLCLSLLFGKFLFLPANEIAFFRIKVHADIGGVCQISIIESRTGQKRLLIRSGDEIAREQFENGACQLAGIVNF